MSSKRVAFTAGKGKEKGKGKGDATTPILQESELFSSEKKLKVSLKSIWKAGGMGDAHKSYTKEGPSRPTLREPAFRKLQCTRMDNDNVACTYLVTAASSGGDAWTIKDLNPTHSCWSGGPKMPIILDDSDDDDEPLSPTTTESSTTSASSYASANEEIGPLSKYLQAYHFTPRASTSKHPSVEHQRSISSPIPAHLSEVGSKRGSLISARRSSTGTARVSTHMRSSMDTSVEPVRQESSSPDASYEWHQGIVQDLGRFVCAEDMEHAIWTIAMLKKRPDCKLWIDHLEEEVYAGNVSELYFERIKPWLAKQYDYYERGPGVAKVARTSDIVS